MSNTLHINRSMKAILAGMCLALLTAILIKLIAPTYYYEIMLLIPLPGYLICILIWFSKTRNQK